MPRGLPERLQAHLVSLRPKLELAIPEAGLAAELRRCCESYLNDMLPDDERGRIDHGAMLWLELLNLLSGLDYVLSSDALLSVEVEEPGGIRYLDAAREPVKFSEFVRWGPLPDALWNLAQNMQPEPDEPELDLAQNLVRFDAWLRPRGYASVLLRGPSEQSPGCVAALVLAADAARLPVLLENLGMHA